MPMVEVSNGGTLEFGIVASNGNDGIDILANNWRKLTVVSFRAGAGSATCYLRNSGQSIGTTVLYSGTVVDISNATDFSIRLTRNVGTNGCQCSIRLD